MPGGPSLRSGLTALLIKFLKFKRTETAFILTHALPGGLGCITLPKTLSRGGRHGFDITGRRVKAHVRGGTVSRLLKAGQRLFGNEFALAA